MADGARSAAAMIFGHENSHLNAAVHGRSDRNCMRETYDGITACATLSHLEKDRDSMIFVALGANLPGAGGIPPRSTLEAALSALPGHGVSISRRSRWYRSAPVPSASQPWFVNAVAEVETALNPAALLAALHRVETALGRVRSEPNAARACDLDLLDFDGRIDLGGGGRPDLPHPRMSERLFVLLPLADLAPGWVHPVTRMPVGALIAGVPPGQRCEPMAD
jgi:2-amino-4-hydroxy-6-hydroxymethyldihydropteridine diphosphokinase